MSENRSDIDINDPNFWQKWAKKADVDTANGVYLLCIKIKKHLAISDQWLQCM
jgi:hypothetical protein